eukprot:jgi/Astpho2/2996/e_gw1.00051.185.1_t
MLAQEAAFRSPPNQAGQGHLQVTFGSLIKLVHEGSKAKLHSHEIAYGSGSGQQSDNDANDYWAIQAPQGQYILQGTPIKSGTVLRLQHMATNKWLHSHDFPSPLTNKREVSAYGSEEQSDTGDVWEVELSKGDPVWLVDSRVKFKHLDTKSWLSSSGRQFGRPINGQKEICGQDKGPAGNWMATEGVYLPQRAPS